MALRYHLILFGLLACQHPERLESSLKGHWVLHSWETERIGQKDHHFPYGPDAMGILNYSDDGYVHLTLQKPVRDSFELASSQGFFSYVGSFVFVPDSGLVHHRVILCSQQDWVGKDQVRQVSFSGDTLLLRSPPLKTRVGGKTPSIHILKWLPGANE